MVSTPTPPRPPSPSKSNTPTSKPRCNFRRPLGELNAPNPLVAFEDIVTRSFPSWEEVGRKYVEDEFLCRKDVNGRAAVWEA